MRIHQAVDILDDHLRFPSRCAAQRRDERNRSRSGNTSTQVLALGPSGLEARGQTAVVAPGHEEWKKGALDLQVALLKRIPFLDDLATLSRARPPSIHPRTQRPTPASVATHTYQVGHRTV